MKFSEAMARSRERGLPVDETTELGQKRALKMERRAELLAIQGDKAAIRGLSPGAKAVLKAIEDVSFVEALELYVLTRVLGEGPKVFRPTAEQLAYLELMDVNVPWRDFHAPFDVMVVELPPEYASTKLSTDPTTGDRRVPDYCILHVDKKVGFASHTAVFDKDAIKAWWVVKDEEAEVEEWLDHKLEKDSGTVPTSTEEQTAEAKLRRAVLNYCLLLDEVGCKQIGPAHPNEYAQLVKWCKKSNKHTEKNRLALTRQPVVYAVEKPVKLVRHEKESSGPGDPTGKHVGPHTRRGHYRMQPYGPSRSEHKRIRIPPVFVNAHLLIGDVPRTYET